MDQRKSIILFVMSIVASFLLVQAVDANDGRIAGGEEATPGEFPWMVSVQTMGGYHYCGATLIAPEWVLTASHCIYGESAGQVKVVIGRHDLTTGEGQTVNVARIIMHPDYGITLDNDIALLKLASPVNDVAPIGLVTAGMGVDDVGKAATISGWGAWSSGGSPLDKLRKVTVPILSNTDCNSNYNVKIKMDMICTGLDEGGKNPCHGDNGGPMMVRNAADDGWLQAGVVSWGLGCTSADRPGVYARVTEFTGWIDAQINGVEPPPPATEETVEGEVTAISAESITLNISITARTAQTFVIDSNTSVDGSPEVGNKVRVRYDTTTNTAVRIRVLDDGGWQFESARGTVTAIDANGLTVDVETQTGIASEQFSIDENTWMLATPDVGDQVRVDYDPTTRFAYSVAVLGGGSGTGTSMRVRGVVTAIDATSISIETETATRVAVETYIIDDATHMRDMPEVGDNVRVRYNTETNVAIRIAVIHNGGGGSMYERVEGTVLDISDNSITIEAVESAYRTSEPLVTVYAIDGMTWMPEMVAVDDYVRIVADAESQTALSIHRMDGGEPPVNTYDRVRGKVTAISALSITIETSGVHHRDAAMTFTIDANTGIEGDPEVGDRVRIEYSTETMLALSIRVVGDDGGWPGWPGQDEYVEITGTVEAISDEAYTVDGVAYAISQDTYVEGDPAIGDVVYIFAEVNEDGTFTALYIAPYEDDLGGGEEYEFDWGGMVTAIDADSITVNNVWFGSQSEDTFIIDSNTVVEGEIVAGDFVEIHALYHSDGSMTALYIEVMDDSKPTIERHEGVVTDISAESLSIDTGDAMRVMLTFALNDETTVSGDPEVGSYVRVKAEKNSAGTLTALRVRVDEPAPIFTTVRGTVTEITTDTITVSDNVSTTARALTTFAIDENTMMRNTPEVGDQVRVKGTEVNGVLTAVHIRVRQAPSEPIEYVEVIGTLELTSTTVYTVDGVAYTLNVDSVIDGEPSVGDMVYVLAMVETDGLTIVYLAKFDQPAERFELEGNLDAFDDMSITVDGQVISLTVDTKIRGTLSVDASVFVKGRMDESGAMVANRVRVRGESTTERFVEALGEITVYSASKIVVDGKTFIIDAEETETEGTLEAGRNAYVFGISEDGITTALFIHIVDEENTIGIIQDLSANGLTINGETIRINNRTRMSGDFVVGDTVYVGLEGSTRAAGEQDALFISTPTFIPTSVQLNSSDVSNQNIAGLFTGLFAALTLGTYRLWTRRFN